MANKKTVSVDVDVEVDISNFSTRDLVDEICERIKYGRLGNATLKELRIAVVGNISFEKKSLLDTLKDEILAEAAKRFTLTELENRLK